jgi:hypothetical protein
LLVNRVHLLPHGHAGCWFIGSIYCSMDMQVVGE